jgi:hypothetical protein
MKWFLNGGYFGFIVGFILAAMCGADLLWSVVFGLALCSPVGGMAWVLSVVWDWHVRAMRGAERIGRNLADRSSQQSVCTILRQHSRR